MDSVWRRGRAIDSVQWNTAQNWPWTFTPACFICTWGCLSKSNTLGFPGAERWRAAQIQECISLVDLKKKKGIWRKCIATAHKISSGCLTFPECVLLSRTPVLSLCYSKAHFVDNKCQWHALPRTLSYLELYTEWRFTKYLLFRLLSPSLYFWFV